MDRPRVLIVDDEPETLASLLKIFRKLGDFEVLTAQDGVEALERAHQYHPDLILSDYMMPEMDGFELCKQVKSERTLAGTMFVVLSGFDDIDLKVAGLDLGVDDYLTKPVEPAELIAKVRASLRVKELHDELREDKEQLERLHAKLGDSFENLLEILVHLLDMRVPGAASRAEWMAASARVMAEGLEIPEKFIEDLEFAALLQEIGKLVSTPSAEDTPWTYLITSCAVLDQIQSLKGAAHLVEAVPEHWDGTGVPGHLMRGQIPLRSRILRVLIDYATLDDEDAAGGLMPVRLSKIEQFAGTRYDPKVVAQLRIVLEHRADTPWAHAKRRVSLTSLAQGMVLAEDLCTSSGIKLLAKGSTITDATLGVILRRHSSDPILYGAWITR
jgi:response regulator RpfG family c-di-GMP phosphodiesterase